uniref:Uncharacterized protein n=1 Tax=viral metagenome TaxID=1070528 RepID=A0A6M3KCL0_9ZZZZ
MIDNKLMEHFIAAKIHLYDKLLEIGDIPGSAEIESAMRVVEARMLERIKQAILQGRDEMISLRVILTETAKPGKET